MDSYNAAAAWRLGRLPAVKIRVSLDDRCQGPRGKSMSLLSEEDFAGGADVLAGLCGALV